MQAYDSVESASSEWAEEGEYNGTNCGLRFYVDTDHTIYSHVFNYQMYIWFGWLDFSTYVYLW